MHPQSVVGEVDGMHSEVCKLSRSSRTSICKEDYQTSPSKGYCASQKLYLWLQITCYCSSNGVFSDFEITQAAVHVYIIWKT